MAKLIQSVRLTQIACMGHDQRLRHRLHPTSRRCSTPCRRHPRRRNAGARRALACLAYDPTARPTIALRPLLREESGLLRGRRGICLCRFIWEDCKGEPVPSPEKPPPLRPKKDSPSPTMSPTLQACLDSEDDSEANETPWDAEAISDKAHAPIPPSPLSPRRTRERSLFVIDACIGCGWGYPGYRDDRAILPVRSHRRRHPPPHSLAPHTRPFLPLS